MGKHRTMLAVCAALLLWAPAAFCQRNFVSTYAGCQNADTLRIGRSTFYSLVSVSGFDRDTRRLMKNLNIGKVIYLNMIECSDRDKYALDDEIRKAAASGEYVAIDSTSVESGRVSMLFYADNGHIKQVVMYTPAPKTSLIQIQCYAKLNALTTARTEAASRKED